MDIQVKRQAYLREKQRQASSILSDVTAEMQVTIDEIRSGATTRRIVACRAEICRRASEFVGPIILADILFCNPSTVRYHTVPAYKDKILAKTRAKRNERAQQRI